ncbi:MAG: hypothetical protein ACR2NN_13145 [Bryobacteraceae bacterium]
MKHLTWLLFLIGVPAFGAGCEAAIGEWKWFNGGAITLQANNILISNGKAEGKWECTNASKGAITLRWKAGFVDTLTVSGDRMSGKNQHGTVVSATRRVIKPKPAR